MTPDIAWFKMKISWNRYIYLLRDGNDIELKFKSRMDDTHKNW